MQSISLRMTGAVLLLLAGLYSSSLYAQVTVSPGSPENGVPSSDTYSSLGSDTLLLLLDFEEGMFPVMDKSSYEHAVVVGGAPAYANPGAAGTYGLQFDGEMDFLEIGSPVIGDNDEFSFEMWVNVEDFQEDQAPDGNWQVWAVKPESCPDCWREATFSILTGALGTRDQTVMSRFWVELEDGPRANVEVPLDTALLEGAWYRILLEHRRAPAADVFDYYAIMQLRDANDAVLNTNYVGYDGRPLNNLDMPLRLGLAAGDRIDDGAGFQGVMDEVKYFSYATGNIAVEGAPSIGEVGYEPYFTADGQFLMALDAEVSPGLGSAVASVSVHVGDGHEFTETELTLNLRGTYSGEITVDFGRILYVYFTATNEDGLTATMPPDAAAEFPRFFDIPLYTENQQLVLLDFEDEQVLDQSGAGHYVNTFGEPTFVQGAIGSHALDLDGTDDYLEVLGSFLGASDEFAVEVRFSVDDFREGTPEGNWSYIVNKPLLCDYCWDAEAFSLLWGMHDSADKRLAARFWNPAFNNGHVEVELSTSMETGTWYHALLEVRQTATGLDPYEVVLELRDPNGDVIDQAHTGLSLQPAAEPTLWPIFIGHIGDRGFLDGQIDQFAFYNYAALGLTVTSSDEIEEVPQTYALSQNYPNPFNPVTAIEFQMPTAQHVRLDVHDMLGRRVATLVDGIRPAGTQQVQFNADHLSSGMYIYRIKAGDFTASRHMMLIK